MTCRTCGRELKHWRDCEPDDPAMNCGGDCAMCQYHFEEDAPAEIRGPKPRGYDEWVTLSHRLLKLPAGTH